MRNQVEYTSSESISIDLCEVLWWTRNENQIRQVFKNIQAVCESSEVSLNEIVKLNVYLSDLSVFSLVNEIMKELFSEPYPARAAIQVAKLPLDSLIEVEGIIVRK